MAFAKVEAKLGLDISPFEAALAKGGKSLAEFGNRATKDFGAKDAGKAIASALNLNLSSVAESLARFVTGVSKETEEAYKGIADASKELADLQIANMEKTLNDEAKYQLLLRQREVILKNATNPGNVAEQGLMGKAQSMLGGVLGTGLIPGTGGGVGKFLGGKLVGRSADDRKAQIDEAQAKANVEAEKLRGQALELEAKIKEKAVANAQKERSIEEDQLSTGQKVFALADDLDQLEKDKATMLKTSLAYQNKEAEILAKKKELQDQLNKDGVEQAARIKKEENEELTRLDLIAAKKKATNGVATAKKDLENAQLDPSRLSIDELSKLQKFDPRISTGTAGLIDQAQQVKSLEAKGEEARSFGRVDESKSFFDQAQEMKQGLKGQVKSDEIKDPFEELKKALSDESTKLGSIDRKLDKLGTNI